MSREYKIYKNKDWYYADYGKLVYLGHYRTFSHLLYHLFTSAKNEEINVIFPKEGSERIPKHPFKDLARLTVREHNKLVRIKEALKQRKEE